MGGQSSSWAHLSPAGVGAWLILRPTFQGTVTDPRKGTYMTIPASQGSIEGADWGLAHQGEGAQEPGAAGRPSAPPRALGTVEGSRTEPRGDRSLESSLQPLESVTLAA